MNTPNRIKFWRQQRGWTLQQLAEASGTTRAQIDKLERGARRLTVDWMVRLAKPLGCDPRSLMNAAAIPAAPAADVIPVYKLRATRKAGRTTRAAAPQMVPRPYFLHNESTACAVIVPDNALAPILCQGQTAFLAPSRKPRKDQAVLVTHADKSCGFYIFVGRVKDKVVLRRLKPKTQETALSSNGITSLYSVIGMII